MRHHRTVTGGRLPADLARTRDFEIVADARRLERLRQAIRREVRAQSSLRSLARDIGVDRGTLRKFLAMESVPQTDNLARIEDWLENRAEVWPPPGAVAFAVLVRDLPGQNRGVVRRQLACLLASAFTEAKMLVPEWLELESAR